MKELPVRKKIRLQGYDYSQAGYYFVTICVKDKRKILGRIVGDAVPSVPGVTLSANVERVGDAVPSVPQVILSDIGEVVQNYLAKMGEVLEYATLVNYVIMPNHVHLLIALDAAAHGGGHNGTQNGACYGTRYNGAQNGTQRTASPTPSPTTPPTTSLTTSSAKAVIPRIVHGMKAVTTKKIGYSIWQRSYHDRIIRDEDEYLRIWQYIEENPARWAEDCYFTS